MKALLSASVLLSFFLASCTLARESVRSTFDADVLRPGTDRAAVDREFGRPDAIGPVNGGTRATYSTGRVDESAKSALLAQRQFVDLVTLGVGEAFDPAALSEDEGKMLLVTFNASDKIVSVAVICASGNLKGTPRPYYKGFICSPTTNG